MSRIVAALFLLSLCCAVEADAATITAVNPLTAVSVGSVVGVSIDISGLTAGKQPGVGAFDIDVGFDAGKVSFQSAQFGSWLDLAGLGDFRAATAGAGSVNVFEVSLDSTGNLIASQPSSFTLVTLSFLTLASGSTPLTVTINSLAAADATALAATTVDGQIAVSSVPEPQAWMQMCFGLCAVGWLVRRHRQSELPTYFR